MKFSKPLHHVWYITVYFGEQLWYGKHKGLDLRTKNKHFPSGIGQPCYAPADGTIIKQYYNAKAGNVLVMDHGEGFTTLYFHLEEFIHPMGTHVKEGTLIAHCGASGEYVKGSHLHWEVRKDGVPQNPLHYLKNEEGEDILKDINMTYEELVEKLYKDGFIKKRVQINLDHKDGSVWYVDKGKRYKIGTNDDDIAILAALMAAEPLSDVERGYPITTKRTDVM